MELDSRTYILDEALATTLSLPTANIDEAENINSDVYSKVENDHREEMILCLQQDNIRLEQELRLAHDQLDYYSKELSCKAKSQQVLENKLRNAAQQNNNLLGEIARYQAARAIADNQGDDACRIAALQERLAELEQSSREMREQLFDDLRISETKLSMAEDTIHSNQECISELERSSNEWRRRFEELSQENEALVRANGEVRNLESAIVEIKQEKEILYQKLDEVLDEKRQLLASRDHLSERISNADTEIVKLREKAQQINESLKNSVMKMVEKENLIRELNARLDELTQSLEKEKKINVELRGSNGCLNKSAGETPTRKKCSMEKAKDANECSRSVAIVFADDAAFNSTTTDLGDLSAMSPIRTTNNELHESRIDLQQQCRSGKSNVTKSKKNSPRNSPSLYSNVLRFRRFLHLLPHRRRPLKLYIRWVFAVYMLVVHILVFRYLVI